MPARLRCFDRAEWWEPSDEYAEKWQDPAKSRWRNAGLEWLIAQGLDPLEAILHRRRARRAEAGYDVGPRSDQ